MDLHMLAGMLQVRPHRISEITNFLLQFGDLLCIPMPLDLELLLLVYGFGLSLQRVRAFFHDHVQSCDFLPS